VPTLTSVQVALLAALRAVDPGEATVSEQVDAAWLAAYVAGEGETDSVKIAARRTMLQHVGPPCGFIAAGTTIAPRWGARRAGSAPNPAQAFCSPL
jgi:hypothetical protein